MLSRTLWLLILMSTIYCYEKESVSTGVWVDNGHGFTVKAELPPKEAKILKDNMLELLDLPRPRKYRHHHQITINNSAPAYLKNIYDELDERGHAPRLEPRKRAAVDAAHIIITFVNKNSKLHQRHKSHRRLIFNLDDVPMADSMMGAELRLYREETPQSLNEELVMHVYLAAKEKSKELAIAKAILPRKGWTSFNVSKAVLSWILFPQTNFGLRLAVTRPGYKHEMHMFEVGVASGHDREEIRPFIVGYFTEPEKEHRPHHRLSRIPRSILPKSEFNIPFYTGYLGHTGTRESQCQKRPLHVSFKDLGWQDWVIAPEGYDANFCNGRCQFPLLAGMNATNHAIIQTLVKMKKAYSNDTRPPPEACCAPRELTTISVLYYDYANNAVLKKYPKMIVKTCGCI